MRFLVCLLATCTASIAYSADFNMAEVAKHNVITDCWVVVSDKVYDITKYIAQHKQQVEKYCGTDPTKTYNETRAGKGHSDMAHNMRKYFLKGNLVK